MEQLNSKIFASTAKIGTFLVLLILFFSFFSVILNYLSKAFPVLEDQILIQTLAEVGLLASGGLAAFLILKFWDHLPFSNLGLSPNGRVVDMMWGTLTAAGLYAVGFGLLLMWGEVKITGAHFNGSYLIQMWIFMLVVAVTEELIVRGFVLGHLLNAGVNRFVALFLSSLLFSLMHFFNPNFSFLPFVNIVLAGLLLGSTYIYTRNLWFPIALHLFWNWLQGPVLGFEVSGGDMGATWLTLKLPENNLINGGTFGFEGSLVCTVLMIALTILILGMQERKLRKKQSL
ncbi:MAG: CPBP family intramembrane metalloprotease [Bacteroides sp.]|jgi:membrane protease YdiL (CAAX protease family)|nr:CPBP family intramembrane metalloprotease [Bacteroides sp.]